jgi:hypothetical protein
MQNLVAASTDLLATRDEVFSPSKMEIVVTVAAAPTGATAMRDRREISIERAMVEKLPIYARFVSNFRRPVPPNLLSNFAAVENRLVGLG